MEALIAASEVLGIHFVVENPRAQMELRPVMRAVVKAGTVVKKVVNYCVYGHLYNKPTTLWTTVRTWVPRGSSGDGRCSARGRCEFGGISEETGRYRHHKIIAGGKDRAVDNSKKAPLRNRVPGQLISEILQCIEL